MKEWVRKYRKRSVEFYRDLSPPQRLSLGALGVTVVIALALLVAWGMSDDMVPVFYATEKDSELSIEQRGRIETKLQDLKIQYQYRNGILHVPAGEKERIVAALYAEPGVLPSSEKVWDWIWEPDWTGTEARTKRKVTISLERKLARMIGSFDNVRDAEVQVAPGDENRTFRDENPARASVLVRLADEDHQLSKQQVTAISQMLSGSMQDLNPADVQISDTQGRHYKVPDPKEYSAQDFLEIQAAFDEYYTAAARKALGPLGEVAYVTASIELDPTSSVREVLKVPKGQATITVKRHERDRTARVEGPEEPGVETNDEKNLSETGPSIETESESEEEIAYVNDETHEKTIIPPNAIKSKRLVVYLPYELAIRNPSGEMPTEEAAKEANRQAATDKYKAALATIASLKPEEIHVDILAYPEEKPIPEASAGEYARFMIEEHGGKIFLGLLALIAVVVVMRALGKAVPPTPEQEVVVEEEEVDKNLEALMRSRTPGRFDPRTQVIRDKIQDIIDENPRGVSAMLRQWSRKE